jgi:hypothetical protein
LQTGRDCFSVFAQDLHAAFNDLHDARVTAGGCFENGRCEHCDLHFVGRLRPPDEFVKIVQGKCAQNFRGEFDFAAAEVVFTQNETQRLDNEKIAASRVSKNVSPTSGFLDPIAASPSDRGAASGIDDDPLAASKRCCQAGIAIVSSDDFRGRPNFSAKTREDRSIFRATAGEKNACPIDLSR